MSDPFPLRGVAVASLCVALGLAGCASEPAPSVIPSDHPANKDAPEAPPLAPSTTLALDDAMPTPATAPAAEQGPYHCPMHKDVVSDQPGKCPKCGMKLVPMTGAAGHEGGHR